MFSETVRKYRKACGLSQEEFAARLDQPLAAFLQIYQPAHFDRVGLRYVNFISRQALRLRSWQWKASGMAASAA